MKFCIQLIRFIDRDGRHFHDVLNFLRDGREKWVRPTDETVLRELLNEAEYYGLDVLMTALRKCSVFWAQNKECE